MRKSTWGWLIGLGLLAIAGGALATMARAEGPLRERLRQRWQQADAGAPAATPGESIAYGNDPAQTLSFWPATAATSTARAPLVLYVHGGGWQRGSKDNATGRWKPAHYPAAGFAFASIDYRLVPAATVEDQATDIARALARLLADAGRLHLDSRRVVLMGHSAGAHLVALVGTDERYLKAAGLSFANLAGVIAIDGAAYDVPAQLQDSPRIMQQTYTQAFGTDPARQRALSPTLQATTPNAPRFLLLHVQREDGVRQNEALAKALKAAGTPVELAGFPGQGLMGHMEINRRLGDPAYPPTATVDAWLKQAVGS